MWIRRPETQSVVVTTQDQKTCLSISNLSTGFVQKYNPAGVQAQGHASLLCFVFVLSLLSIKCLTQQMVRRSLQPPLSTLSTVSLYPAQADRQRGRAGFPLVYRHRGLSRHSSPSPHTHIPCPRPRPARRRRSSRRRRPQPRTRTPRRCHTHSHSPHRCRTHSHTPRRCHSHSPRCPAHTHTPCCPAHSHAGPCSSSCWPRPRPSPRRRTSRSPCRTRSPSALVLCW